MRNNSRAFRWFRFAVWSAFACIPLVGSCYSDAPGIHEQTEAYGTVTLPLEATAPSGAIYRLVGEFAITGETTLSLSTVGHTGSTISQQLEVGAYTIALNPGWSLLRNESGAFVPTSNAQLVGPSTQAFEITRDAVTRVTFSFEVDGQTVFAKGDLEVSFNVQDRTPGVGGAGGAGGCDAGSADCNGIADDGCEVDYLTDHLNCGSCGVQCPSDSGCNEGACVQGYGCNEGYQGSIYSRIGELHPFDSCQVCSASLTWTDRDIPGCGCNGAAWCPSTTSNTVECLRYPACVVDGPMNCGLDNVPCWCRLIETCRRFGDRSTCNSQAGCDWGCFLPYFMCGATCVDLSTDSANCGACSNACAPGQPCTNGACSTP